MRPTEKRSSTTLLMTGLVIFIIAITSIAQLVLREFTTFIGDYTHVDEIFFAVCAAQASAAGEIGTAGCHDNKAPLIYLLYQLVEFVGGRFSLQAIKFAGTLIVLLNVASVGLLAWKICGWLAGLVAAALAAQAFAVHPELLALKTETVGVLFLLAGTALLIRWLVHGKLTVLFTAGLVFGLAVMTKQTFAFAIFAAYIWFLTRSTRGTAISIADRGLHGLMFTLGVLLPLGAFALLFWSRGQLPDFLASVFLHPLAYGAGGAPTSMAEKAWKAGWLFHHFGLVYPLTLLFVATVVWCLQQNLSRHAEPDANQAALGLVVLQALGLILIPIVSRQFFQPHLIPAWLLMAVAAGVMVQNWHRAHLVLPGAGRDAFLPSASLLLASFVFMAVDSWYLNGSVAARELSKQHLLDADSRIEGARGVYGYVQGGRPEFYFFNGIVPSSDVLYPAALLDTPATLNSVPPSTEASALHRWNTSVQQHASLRLQQHLQARPPRYVLLVDLWAKRSGSDAVSQVAVIADYVTRNCDFLRRVKGKPYQAGVLFACSRPGAQISDVDVAVPPRQP